MSKEVYVDINKCLACRSCELACSVAHSSSGVLAGALNEKPLPARMIGLESSGTDCAPIKCIHCDEAPCVEVCPAGALQKKPGQVSVSVESDLCVGCKMCTIVCPLGVLQISVAGRSALKCESCSELTEKGKDPACVQACPTKALRFQ